MLARTLPKHRRMRRNGELCLWVCFVVRFMSKILWTIPYIIEMRTTPAFDAASQTCPTRPKDSRRTVQASSLPVFLIPSIILYQRQEILFAACTIRCARAGKSALAEKDKFLVANGGHGGSCFTKLISSLVTNTYIIYIGKRKNWKAQFLRCYFYKWVHVNKLFCTCPWSYLTSILLSRLRSYLHRCIQTLSKQSWRVQQTYQRLWIPYLKNGRSIFGDSDR